jgi:hypothetical protein
MIVGVAVKFGDFIEVRMPAPNRHCHCFWHFAEVTGLESLPTGLRTGGENQGFYTHTGRYLNREQALKYVRRIKQPLREETKRYLFSENLW